MTKVPDSIHQQMPAPGTNPWTTYCQGISTALPTPGKLNGSHDVTIEEPSQPGMAERAIDTATDVSRTLTEVSEGLQAAVGRLSDAVAVAQRPGMPLSTISAITREAPLASLFVAFLFGVAIGRRR
jgi:hypothetical protein